MISRLYWIFEICSIICCIHLLYGKKVRDILHPIILVSVDVIILSMIEYFQLPSISTLLINGAIVVYCLAEFGNNLRALAANNILCMIIQVLLQVIGAFLATLLPFAKEQEMIYTLLINVFVLGVTAGILPRFQLDRVSLFVRRRNKGLWCSMLVGAVLAFLPVLQTKMRDYVDSDLSLILAIGASVICCLCYQWQVNSYTKSLLTRYLNAYARNNKAYEELLNDIRRKQHDYKNLINSIYCQHYTCSTYQELVEVQSKYCKILLEDAQKQDIFDTGDSVLTAFLHSKIIEARERDVAVKGRGKIAFSNDPRAVMAQIEILGNLLDNAVEAAVSDENRIVYLQSTACDEGNGFEIRNAIDEEACIDVGRLAEWGYSTKGENRGFGLYNVKCICEENGWILKINVEKRDEIRWICIAVLRKGG